MFFKLTIKIIYTKKTVTQICREATFSTSFCVAWKNVILNKGCHRMDKANKLHLN